MPLWMQLTAIVDLVEDNGKKVPKTRPVIVNMEHVISFGATRDKDSFTQLLCVDGTAYPVMEKMEDIDATMAEVLKSRGRK